MIDPGTVGLTLPVYAKSWSSSEAILYALGVGSDTHELQYTTENSHGVAQQVLPSFGVIIARPTSILAEIGTFDWGKLVHARQALRLHGDIPVEGTALITERVVSIADKGAGRHAVVVVAADAHLPSGDLLLTAEMTVLIRGGGGFGGRDVAGGVRAPIPDGPAQHQVEQRTWQDQPLLYRLSGDRNPLHSDPWFAVHRAGFPRPILHGLCTFGMACRALLGVRAGGGSIRSLDARFSSPVLPGEPLTTHVWPAAGGAVFRVTAGPDDRVVLDGGTVEFTQPD